MVKKAQKRAEGVSTPLSWKVAEIHSIIMIYHEISCDIMRYHMRYHANLRVTRQKIRPSPNEALLTREGVALGGWVALNSHEHINKIH